MARPPPPPASAQAPRGDFKFTCMEFSTFQGRYLFQSAPTSAHQFALYNILLLLTIPGNSLNEANGKKSMDHLPPALGRRRSLPWSVPGNDRRATSKWTAQGWSSSGPGIDELVAKGAASFRLPPSARAAVKITGKNGCDRFSATGQRCRAPARAVRAHREAARPIVASHGGRIVRSTQATSNWKSTGLRRRAAADWGGRRGPLVPGWN